MTLPCPKCGATMRLRYRRPNAAGSLSSRHDCIGCGHRHIDRDSSYQPRQRRYSDATIAAIRSSTASKRTLAAEHGCSVTLILAIQSGRLYRDLVPAGAAPLSSITCHRCVHWVDGGCSLGIPEAVEIGPQFARECAAWGEEGSAPAPLATDGIRC